MPRPALPTPPAWVGDVALAAGLLVLTVSLDHDLLAGNEKIDFFTGGHAAWLRLIRLWWIGTTAAMVAILARRRVPLTAFTVAGGAAVLHIGWATNVPATPVDLAAPITLYTVAANARHPVVSRLALVAGLVVAVPLALRYKSPWGTWGGPLLPPILLALAWFAGDATRNRRAHLTTLEQRAQALARQRDQQSEIATAAERARIARELHDAVAHALAVIVLQAQAGTSALRHRPERTEQALTAITSSGRAAMAEVRRLLGMYGPDGAAQLAPLPDLSTLDDLLDRVRGAGLPVTATITGRVDDLPAGVGLSAYRITQEALTNALKHAGPAATAHVSVERELAALCLTIADTGQGVPAGLDWTPGNGVRGIRERVAALGGTLSIGPRPRGGFALHARLPVEAP
jgi:signal transduction histidine kinase